MSDKIHAYLKETELHNAAVGTWGIGALITRATASPLISMKSLKSIEDQFVITKNCDSILPVIADTVKTLAMK